MEILICGANDLKVLKAFWEEVASAFGTQFKVFLDGTSGGSNNKTWSESSRDAVNRADLIIYIIFNNYGSITWETEFKTAKNEGKQFLIFCLEETWDYYLNTTAKSKKIYDSNKKENRIFQVIEELLADEFDIKPYTLKSFQQRLRYFLLEKFEEAIKLLEFETRKKKITNLVVLRDFEALEKKFSHENEKEYLYKVLFDVYENKEIRKRLLEFFARTVGLENAQIISLLNDAEQGISRRTIELLPELVKRNVDLDDIFKTAVELSNNADDVGTDRRIIQALLKLDPKKAVVALQELFPADDIGTPKRVLSFFVDNDIQLPKDAVKNLQKLVISCEAFNKKTDTITNLAEIIRKKYKFDAKIGSPKKK